MTDERTSGSGNANDNVDPTFDPAPVFDGAAPAAHPGHPALRRALDHAPDRGNEPDDELRQAIRSFAHESAAPSLPAGRTGRLGRRGGDGATGLEARTNARRSRLLRNLIVAAVLVVIVASVTWHREPGPGGGRPAATAPEAVVAPEPVAPVAPAASAPTPVAAASAPATPPALSEAEKILFAPRVTPPPAPSATPAPAPGASAAAAAAPRTPVPAAPAAASPTPGATAERAKPAAPTPAIPSTAVPAPMPTPAPTPGGRAAASFAGPGSASVPSAPATAESLPPGAPTFSALSQWTHLTMTRADGSTRRRSKAEARELGALLSSAALAGAGAEPVRGRVDWRVSLERNGQTLARVELAGKQVRWIANGAAPGSGTPPAGSLDSVREMLENVFEESAPAAASRPAPVPAPAPVEVPGR